MTVPEFEPRTLAKNMRQDNTLLSTALIGPDGIKVSITHDKGVVGVVSEGA